MRLLINLLIIMMLAAILAGVVFHYQQEDKKSLDLQVVHQAMTQLQEQVYYHGALTDSTAAQASYPREISPKWFPDGPPRNTLVPITQPWVDVAAADDHGDQPPDPIIRRPDQAGFWYNPNRGIFRARVMPQLTMSGTLDLYNHVNGTSLTELVERSPTPRLQAKRQWWTLTSPKCPTPTQRWTSRR